MVALFIVQAIREKHTSEGGKGIIVVYVMNNILSYGPNLEIEIGGNGGHFKKGLTLDFYKILQHVIATT